MRTFIDLCPYDFSSKYIVLINHKTTKEFSIVGCDKPDELAYLGCDNIENVPVGYPFSFTDNEGEKHEITILYKRD